MIELKGLCSGYPGRPVLEDVTLALRPGEVLAILGPNGCGKSTLLKTANGLLSRSAGEVLLDELPIERYAPKEIARRVAYLPQSRTIPNITARRMVLHGRFPYLSYPRHYGKKDHEMVRDALRWVGAEELAHRELPRLSGGQRQKIYLAMALAQDTQTVLMDEPTTYLDVSSQMEVMGLAQRIAREGKSVVLVLHDLCMAFQYADRIALFREGRLFQSGTPEELYAGRGVDEVMSVKLGRVQTQDGFRYYYL